MTDTLECFQKIQTALLSVQHELDMLQQKHDKIERALLELHTAKSEYLLALSHATGVDSQLLNHYLK
ncbi:hypothetical protein [Bacillus marinisedimentorum]|uniref:hypothetical protein n=1 Tax=Bacillus marinisedimentorum TaxID=1821260 RepID=UPI0007DFAB78|nr:hypothetical protein [Bacillus marinisedimentorum]